MATYYFGLTSSHKEDGSVSIDVVEVEKDERCLDIATAVVKLLTEDDNVIVRAEMVKRKSALSREKNFQKQLQEVIEYVIDYSHKVIEQSSSEPS